MHEQETPSAAAEASTPGQLLVVSGPGGVGKGTVVRALLDARDDLSVSISATTRAMRPGEVDGVHYHFMTRRQFEALRDGGGFLEWAEFNGNYYGTPWTSITEPLAAGATVILEIDVQGAEQVRRRADEVGDISPVLVFLLPPSAEELEERLRGRATDSEEIIRQRLEIGRQEIARAADFDHRVVNHSVDGAVAELERILAGTVDS